MVVNRKSETENTSRAQYTAVQGKILKQRYSQDRCVRPIYVCMYIYVCVGLSLHACFALCALQDKWVKVKQSRKDLGLWYKDEIFPDDTDDVCWLHSGFFGIALVACVSMSAWGVRP